MAIPTPINLLVRDSSSPKNCSYVTVHVGGGGYIAKAFVQMDYAERLANLSVREEKTVIHTHKRESSSPKNALMVSSHPFILDASPMPIETFISAIDVCNSGTATTKDRGGL